jgi:DNA-binding PadR family transcriptional regulator
LRGPQQPYGGRSDRQRHHFHHPDGPGSGRDHNPWADAQFFGRGGRGGGPRRARRGDIRAAVLAALADGPAHGYEVMRRLEERSGGLWRPSPGSVYPMLQLLEDEGLAKGVELDGRRTYQLTDEGTAEAQRRSTDKSPWASDDPAMAGQLALRDSLRQLQAAAYQVGGAGSPEQIEQATAAISQARQALYTILAQA